MFSKVYIIDDDEVTLYLTGLVLSLYAPESHCVSFQHAPEALDQLKQDLKEDSLPGFIFLDLNMPVMDGLQLLEALGTIFSDAHALPQVYVLTSSISETDKVACRKYPLLLDVIEKPLTDKKLEEISIQNTSIPFGSRTLKSDPI